MKLNNINEIIDFNIFTNNTEPECPVVKILILNTRAFDFR